MTILVTGGAGYIGSHCVWQLLQVGHKVVILDNNSSSLSIPLPFEVPFYMVDIIDQEQVMSILQTESIDAVMHFAGPSCLQNSVKNPLHYYQNIVGGTLSLLKAMEAVGLRQIIFSSTCAVYGIPTAVPTTEASPCHPITPYGSAKLYVERILKDLVTLKRWSVAVFRYFNVIGGGASKRLGDIHEHETRLVPRMIQSLLSKQPHFDIYGNDYPTPDGTCIRDYIHVEDICQAHVMGLSKIQTAEAAWQVYNLGLNRPYSVKEIIQAMEAVTGHVVPARFLPRRLGDPPILYADNTKVGCELGWKPRYIDLEAMLESAWNVACQV